MRLFVGDDWAEDHHDVEVMDAAGRKLAKARLPEGVAGMARLHGLIGEHRGEPIGAGESCDVVVGIETDRGSWVQALLAAGYTVFAVNPLQAARYRDWLAVSGAKSDAADAPMLADMVRTDSHQLRPIAGDSSRVEAVKVVARAHKTLIWERTRHCQRMRHALREYYPAALAAFNDLDAPDALELLAKAPDPVSAARLTLAQIGAVLKRARRRNIPEKAAGIQTALRTKHLEQPQIVAAAFAVTVMSTVAILRVLNEQIAVLHQQVQAQFAQHPAAKIVESQPGLGPILGARVLGEFGDARDRYASARARKNYAGTSPITRASGRRKVVLARFVHNDRLLDALDSQAYAALKVSPGARAYHSRLRDRGASLSAALRQLANRLVGILHGCLKTGTGYDEATAWSHHAQAAAA